MGLIPAKGDGRGVMLIAVSSVSLALAIVAVFLRIWSRRLKKRSLVTNDYLVLFALLLAVVEFAILVAAVEQGGLGQHIIELESDPEKLVFFGKTYIAEQPCWITAITAVKISILDLYINIFGTNKTLRRLCYGAMVFFAFFWLSDMLVVFLICRPLALSWNLTIKHGHCGNQTAVYIAVHSINTVIDIFLAVLPMPVLWRLQMPTRRKVELSVMFSLGTLICTISLLRIAFWRDIKGMDTTYDIVPLYLFTILEPLLGIVLASLPFLRPAGTQIASSAAFAWFKSALENERSKPSFGRTPPLGVNLTSRSAEAQKFNRLHDGSDTDKPEGDVESHPMETF